MIIENIVGFFTSLICQAISACGVLSLSLDGIKTLQAITCYGSYVIGSDMLLIVCTTIAFWLSVKIGLGLILFIWRLLPLT